jgi:hypothetical protein
VAAVAVVFQTFLVVLAVEAVVAEYAVEVEVTGSDG